MSARDLLHPMVVRALLSDGWTITHDPLIVRYASTYTEIDLGAEKLIAAEKGPDRIAVEIKSFLGQSMLSEFHVALGQYLNYREALLEQTSDRKLYLAVPDKAYETFFEQEIVQRTLKRYGVSLLVFNTTTQRVERWIKTS